MPKKPIRHRLQLETRTLRRLAVTDLGQVAGAAVVTMTIDCPTATCLTGVSGTCPSRTRTTA